MAKKDLRHGKWINRRTKKVMAGAIFFLVLLVISSFKINLTSNLIFFLILLGYVLLAITVEEELQDFFGNAVSMIILLLLILIIASWIFGFNLPYLNLEMQDSTIIAIFTVVLAMAAIFTYQHHKKLLGLSRLTNISVKLNEDLDLDVVNEGQFDARGIRVEYEVNKKGKTKLFKERFFKNLRERFFILEDDLHLLGIKEGIHLPLSNFIKKSFKIKKDERIEKNEGLEFYLFVKVKYHSETYFRSPLPVFHKFQVVISKGRIHIRKDYFDPRLSIESYPE